MKYVDVFAVSVGPHRIQNFPDVYVFFIHGYRPQLNSAAFFFSLFRKIRHAEFVVFCLDILCFP